MIRLDKVEMVVGGTVLLSEVNWHVHPGERIGLVGRNGTGKTTILRAMAGELDADRGTIALRSGVQLGYLPQHSVSGSVLTVWDEVASGMTQLSELKAQLAKAEADVAAGLPQADLKLDDALEKFRHAGGYTEEERIGEVLHGLGFAATSWHRSCQTFSGGWQMRISLAKLLLSTPDIALLDEPSNHLDILARSWLAAHLRTAPFAVVVVSHDRHLLDVSVNRIVEVRGKRLHHYSGNYTRFLAERSLREQQHAQAWQRQQDEIEKLENFITRFGAKATKASQANARKKQLDKIDRLQVPETLRSTRYSLPPAPAGALESVLLRNATIGWPDSPAILQNITLILERGMRLAILGANGCGKSTLLQSLAGTLPLQGGRRRTGDRIRLGVFSQDLAAALPKDKTGVEYVRSAAPLLEETQLRSVLGALNLSGGHALRPIGRLSGGEKARVALAALCCRPCNVLLLDEPTNHLDTETVDVLVEALKQYEGAMVLVTHDRYLVESLATHVAVISEGQMDLHAGVRAEDLTLKPQARAHRESNRAGADSWEARKQRRRDRQKKERRLATVQTELEKTEAILQTIDDQLCLPGANYPALSKKRAEVEATITNFYSEWESLEDWLAQDDSVKIPVL